jgi:hypothetical protein
MATICSSLKRFFITALSGPRFYIIRPGHFRGSGQKSLSFPLIPARRRRINPGAGISVRDRARAPVMSLPRLLDKNDVISAAEASTGAPTVHAARTEDSAEPAFAASSHDW